VGTFGAVKGQDPGNKGRTFPPEPLTPDEVAAIIGECSARSRTGIRNRALLTILYRSGLRISEALALKPADVDFKRHACRVLHVKGDKATVRGFHPSADDALARWIDTRKGLGLRNGPFRPCRRCLATRTTRRPSGTRTWPRTRMTRSSSRGRGGVTHAAARTGRGPSLMTRTGL
jgi:integrase